MFRAIKIISNIGSSRIFRRSFCIKRISWWSQAAGGEGNPINWSKIIRCNFSYFSAPLYGIIYTYNITYQHILPTYFYQYFFNTDLSWAEHVIRLIVAIKQNNQKQLPLFFPSSSICYQSYQYILLLYLTNISYQYTLPIHLTNIS